MKKKLILTATVIFVFALISCRKDEQEPMKNISEMTEETVKESFVEEKSYLVSLCDTQLSLYENCGDKKSVISTVKIAVNAYPKEDIDRLEAGIEAETLEKGYEILENFAN